MSPTASAAVRRRLGHPVIDSDGHLVEFLPAFLDFLKSAGGERVATRFQAAWNETSLSSSWYDLSPAERRDVRAIRPAFWNVPTKNTRDLATAMFPKLMYERLEEVGSDFAVLYPGLGLATPVFRDEEVRRASCRALNAMYADTYLEFADRLTPVAVIPMHTPEEAMEELDYAIGVLGLKAIVMASYVQRPVPAVLRDHPGAIRHAFWLDTFGIDSAYDYDPVWRRCEELGVSPTFHSGGMGFTTRSSISSYMYNHIGHFAAAAEAVCKSLFLGGVTRRFPELRFSFLEGGAGWARNLLCDLVGHWQKRNRKSMQNYDPSLLDRDQFAELFRRYGGKLAVGRELVEGSELLQTVTGTPETEATLDEWQHCEIARVEDIRDLFVDNFYFGCEPDDPITATAFDASQNPFGEKLNVLYGSDIGHWDVPDMNDVLAEAWEPVEKGWITESDFRDFLFRNPASFWTAQNPKFFHGTAVEQDVASLLASAR